MPVIRKNWVTCRRSQADIRDAARPAPDESTPTRRIELLRRTGQNVGVKEVSDKIWLVTFMHYDLGFFDHETGRLENVDNPFAAKVLPMSPV
jgi:hypothetical protein